MKLDDPLFNLCFIFRALGIVRESVRVSTGSFPPLRKKTRPSTQPPALHTPALSSDQQQYLLFHSLGRFEVFGFFCTRYSRKCQMLMGPRKSAMVD